MTEKGDPFFWLGDTVWLLFSKLNPEEAEKYLNNLAEEGYNVIQTLVLHELQITIFYGDSALLNFDVSQPNVTQRNSFENKTKCLLTRCNTIA